jgi:hypothetical protein
LLFGKPTSLAGMPAPPYPRSRRNSCACNSNNVIYTYALYIIDIYIFFILKIITASTLALSVVNRRVTGSLISAANFIQRCRVSLTQ